MHSSVSGQYNSLAMALHPLAPASMPVSEEGAIVGGVDLGQTVWND
jgi:hypothetical protein